MQEQEQRSEELRNILKRVETDPILYKAGSKSRRIAVEFYSSLLTREDALGDARFVCKVCHRVGLKYIDSHVIKTTLCRKCFNKASNSRRQKN